MRAVPGLALLACTLVVAAPLCAAASGAGPASRAHGSAGANHVVTIEAMQFTPPALEVHVGDTVTWQNKDPFPHNVTAASVLRSGDLDSGASWKFKARKKGEYPYVCTLHPGMTGTLIVK